MNNCAGSPTFESKVSKNSLHYTRATNHHNSRAVNPNSLHDKDPVSSSSLQTSVYRDSYHFCPSPRDSSLHGKTKQNYPIEFSSRHQPSNLPHRFIGNEEPKHAAQPPANVVGSRRGSNPITAPPPRKRRMSNPQIHHNKRRPSVSNQSVHSGVGIDPSMKEKASAISNPSQYLTKMNQRQNDKEDWEDDLEREDDRTMNSRRNPPVLSESETVDSNRILSKGVEGEKRRKLRETRRSTDPHESELTAQRSNNRSNIVAAKTFQSDPSILTNGFNSSRSTRFLTSATTMSPRQARDSTRLRSRERSNDVSVSINEDGMRSTRGHQSSQRRNQRPREIESSPNTSHYESPETETLYKLTNNTSARNNSNSRAASSRHNNHDNHSQDVSSIQRPSKYEMHQRHHNGSTIANQTHGTTPRPNHHQRSAAYAVPTTDQSLSPPLSSSTQSRRRKQNSPTDTTVDIGIDEEGSTYRSDHILVPIRPSATIALPPLSLGKATRRESGSSQRHQYHRGQLSPKSNDTNSNGVTIATPSTATSTHHTGVPSSFKSNPQQQQRSKQASKERPSSPRSILIDSSKKVSDQFEAEGDGGEPSTSVQPTNSKGMEAGGGSPLKRSKTIQFKMGLDLIPWEEYEKEAAAKSRPVKPPERHSSIFDPFSLESAKAEAKRLEELSQLEQQLQRMSKTILLLLLALTVLWLTGAIIACFTDSWWFALAFFGLLFLIPFIGYSYRTLSETVLKGQLTVLPVICLLVVVLTVAVIAERGKSISVLEVLCFVFAILALAVYAVFTWHAAVAGHLISRRNEVLFLHQLLKHPQAMTNYSAMGATGDFGYSNIVTTIPISTTTAERKDDYAYKDDDHHTNGQDAIPSLSPTALPSQQDRSTTNRCKDGRKRMSSLSKNRPITASSTTISRRSSLKDSRNSPRRIDHRFPDVGKSTRQSRTSRRSSLR